MRRPADPSARGGAPSAPSPEPAPTRPRWWRRGGGEQDPAQAGPDDAAHHPPSARRAQAGPDDADHHPPSAHRSPGEPGEHPARLGGTETGPTREAAVPAVREEPEPPAVIPPTPVVGLQERIDERDRAARRAFWRRVVIWTGVALAALGVAWGVFFSPLFALERGRISITSEPGHVDMGAVRQLANERVGTPLPRLDSGALREEIRAVPTVLDASVHREWPQGLAIHLTPRTPVAAVPVDGGVQLYDAEGVDLGTMAEQPEGVPVAQVPLGEETAGILADIATVMGVVPPDVLAQIATVGADSQDAIEFTLHSGAVVRWGGNSDNELKAAVLDTLLAEVEASFYDVSSPRSPITS